MLDYQFIDGVVQYWLLATPYEKEQWSKMRITSQNITATHEVALSVRPDLKREVVPWS